MDLRMLFSWTLRHRYAAAAFLLAGILLGCVFLRTTRHPRTDDASVRANYIELAPEVTGRLIELHVRDNALVKAGSVLFVIDPRPYQYELDQALSDQQLLEQQILDMQRRIAAQHGAIDAARASVAGSHSSRQSATGSVQVADAAVERARAYLQSMQEQKDLAVKHLQRLEPLLVKQYVTPDQVDDARTKASVAQHNEQEARAALSEMLAQQMRSRALEQEAAAGIIASKAHLEQSENSVERLETLEAQRSAKAARVASAKLDLERCTVHAPFDGYVTNLNISEGQMAKPGVPIFTLIDNRNWYVVASYRESELHYIVPGHRADIYLLGRPGQRFEGVVESIGNGVVPEDSNTANGLPQVDHTLNWVHLAARFPVRIRIEHPEAGELRMGETAISIVR